MTHSADEANNRAAEQTPPDAKTPRWAYAFMVVLALVAAVVVVLHLSGLGLGSHVH